MKPEKVEAGTGFYQHKFDRGDIKSALGQVEMTKHDAGVAWGSVHWQYLEDMAKVTPHEATPLRLAKEILHPRKHEVRPSAQGNRERPRTRR